MTAHHAHAGGRGRWPVLLLLACIGCGPSQSFFHDARETPNGAAIEMASLMPSCGCVTLTSLARDGAAPTEETGSGVIELVASLHGAERGSMRLAPGQSERLKYDWAGPENVDRYEIQAHAVTADGRRGARLRPIARYVDLAEKVESNCQENLCTFNSLRLDRAAYAVGYQGNLDHLRRGVDFTSQGQLLEAVASPQTCGCMVLRNANPDRSTVHLQAVFAGQLVGRFELPWPAAADELPAQVFGFDWGGTLGREAYVISVAGLGDQADGAAAPLPGSVAQRPPRIQDYVSVVGQFDGLDCTPEGAVIWVPRPGGAPTPDGGISLQSAYPVTCPFDAANMRRMVQAASPPPGGQPPADPAGSTSPKRQS